MIAPSRLQTLPRRDLPEGAAWILVAITVAFLTLFLVVPVVAVFAVAFSRGVAGFVRAVSTPETAAALRLTAATALVAVPLNTLFGVVAAWTVTKYRFRGKTLLLTLMDLPFAVSPVVAGLMFVLLFGARSTLGAWLGDHGVRVLFAFPGIALATLFVTFPFVARELVPLMEALGSEEEIAASSLGASSWQIFWRVTLPNIRWGLFYGVIVCTARALGEFGAVSVVSGHIRGETNTVPLHVEILFNEYDQAGAFAVASLLTLVGLAALVAKKLVEWRIASQEGVQ